MNRKLVKLTRIFPIVFVLFLLSGCSDTTTTTSTNQTSSSSLMVTYLSVGQADAAVLSCDGHYAMIDCGSDSIQEDGFNSLKVDFFLRQEGIESFDYIFCSHYDEDHYSGFADILDGRDVGKALGPSGINDYDVQKLNAFKNSLSDHHIKMKTPKIGDTFKLGSATIEVLAVDASTISTQKNDASLVLLLTYGDTKFLFTGDAESKTEAAMLNGEISIKCDVLKVAHHGSSTSSSDGFLAKAKPTYAILSVAPNRALPSNVVFERLTSQGVEPQNIYRTDEKGNITCKSDGKHIQIYDTNGTQIND